MIKVKLHCFTFSLALALLSEAGNIPTTIVNATIGANYVEKDSKVTTGNKAHLRTPVSVSVSEQVNNGPITPKKGILVTPKSIRTAAQPPAQDFFLDAQGKSSGKTNDAGIYDTTLRTLDETPSLKVEALNHTSAEHNMLPAVFKNTFHCTVYYSFKESGVTAAKGYSAADITIKTDTVEGKVIKAKTAFWNRVAMEGCGVLETEQNGVKYVAHNGTSFYLPPQPEGYGSGPSKRNFLVPCKTCAHDLTYIGKGWKLRVDDDRVNATFSNNIFTTNDKGPAIKEYELDLYYGEAEIFKKGADFPELPAGKDWVEGSGIQVTLIQTQP